MNNGDLRNNKIPGFNPIHSKLTPVEVAKKHSIEEGKITRIALDALAPINDDNDELVTLSTSAKALDKIAFEEIASIQKSLEALGKIPPSEKVEKLHQHILNLESNLRIHNTVIEKLNKKIPEALASFRCPIHAEALKKLSEISGELVQRIKSSKEVEDRKLILSNTELINYWKNDLIPSYRSNLPPIITAVFEHFKIPPKDLIIYQGIAENKFKRFLENNITNEMLRDKNLAAKLSAQFLVLFKESIPTSKETSSNSRNKQISLNDIPKGVLELINYFHIDIAFHSHFKIANKVYVEASVKELLTRLLTDEKCQIDLLKKPLKISLDRLANSDELVKILSELKNAQNNLLRTVEIRANEIEKVSANQKAEAKIAAEKEKNAQMLQNITKVISDIDKGEDYVSRNVILESYQTIQDIDKSSIDAKQKDELRSKYNAALSKSYLLHQIEVYKGKFPVIPESLRMLLPILGIQPATFEKQTYAVAPAFVQSLQQLIQTDFSKSDPLKIVKTIEDLFVDHLINALQISPEVSLICKKMNDYKIIWQTEEQKLRIISLKSGSNPANLHINPKVFNESLQDLMKLLDPYKNSLKDNTGKILAELNQKVEDYIAEKTKGGVFKENVLAALKKIKPIPKAPSMKALIRSFSEWEKNNKDNRLFEFSQTSSGIQAVLGEGCCTAINLRWIFALQKNPSKNFRSAAELDPSFSEDFIDTNSANLEILQNQNLMKSLAEKDKERDFALKINKLKKSQEDVELDEWDVRPSSPFEDENTRATVKAKDRFTFVNYGLAVKLGSVENPDVINPALLKEFGVKQQFIVLRNTPERTISNLIDKLSAAPIDLNTHGIFDVSIFGENGGHSMGVQLNSISGMYRFWDVNSGMYSYESLPQLKAGISSYISAVYGTKYTGFAASQYIADIQAQSVSKDDANFLRNCEGLLNKEIFPKWLNKIQNREDAFKSEALRLLTNNALKQKFWRTAFDIAMQFPTQQLRDFYFDKILNTMKPGTVESVKKGFTYLSDPKNPKIQAEFKAFVSTSKVKISFEEWALKLEKLRYAAHVLHQSAE